MKQSSLLNTIGPIRINHHHNRVFQLDDRRGHPEPAEELWALLCIGFVYGDIRM